MYKEALLKQQQANASSSDSSDVPPTPNKLPSVEFFVGFREKTYDGLSVTSTDNTTKGVTPSESWADDDDEFMACVMTTGTQPFQAKPKHSKTNSQGKWKEVKQLGGGGTKENRKQGGSSHHAPPSSAPTQAVSCGRFDALAPAKDKRWR